MKILFVTDLHGNSENYQRVLELARERGVQAVINGGDMLPKDRDLHSGQRSSKHSLISPHQHRSSLIWLFYWPATSIVAGIRLIPGDSSFPFIRDKRIRTAR